MKYLMMGLICLCAYSGAAHAEDSPREALKKVNFNMCMQLGTALPSSPKDAKLVQPNCKCVNDTYWDGLPQKDMDDLVNGTPPKPGDNSSQIRFKAVQASCKKKLGF